MSVRCVVFISAALITVTAAVAEPATSNGGQEATWRAGCTRDAFAFCPLAALTGNRSRVRKCLYRNIARVSDRCRAVLNTAQAQGLSDPSESSAFAAPASPAAPPSN